MDVLLAFVVGVLANITWDYLREPFAKTLQAIRITLRTKKERRSRAKGRRSKAKGGE
ncbi:MAG: hypothetical protein FWH20_04850 [Oscillospiraceae bacterium]|nr:hypothetical protein [Oscillospiraceae bacterium]